MSTNTWYRWEGADLLLSLKLQPRASKNEFGEILDDHRKLRLTAPPVEGAANTALCRFLAEYFEVPKGQVILESGEKTRYKVIRIKSPMRKPSEMV